MVYCPPSSSWLAASDYPTCNHDYAHMFFAVGSNSPVLACAPCMVKVCIAEIKAAQAGLRDRGGVYLSRDRGQNDHIDGRPTQHQGWTNKLRTDKVRCYGVVRRLEQIKADEPSKAETYGIEEALAIWEEAKQLCREIPGYRYVDDHLEESAAAKRDNDEEPGKKAQEDPAGLPEPPSYRAWLNSNMLVAASTQLTSITPIAQDAELSAPKDLGDCGNKSLYVPQKSRRKRTFAIKPRAENDFTKTTAPQASLASDTHRTSFSDSKGPPDVTPAASCAPEPSIIDEATKTLTISSPSKPVARPSPGKERKVAIDPLATVWPHYGDSCKIFEKAHNSHTSALESHRRALYHRDAKNPTLMNRYSTWASPYGYTKVNTSHFGTTWPSYDILQRSLNREDQISRYNANCDEDCFADAEDSVEDQERGVKVEGPRSRVVVSRCFEKVGLGRGSKAKVELALRKKVIWKQEESER